MRTVSGDPSRTGSGWDGEWAKYAFLASALVVVHLALLFFLVPGVAERTLFDPDSYTRLLRVAHLIETGGWFESVFPRMNAPFGLEFHWTRPLDLILLAGSLLLTPALGFDQALHWSGVLVSPALHILACLSLAWAVKPLLGSRKAALVIIVLLAQPIVSGYALAGRADHHMLLVLAYVLSLGFFLRFVLRTDARWVSLTSGAFAGFGVWSSIEFLIPLLTLFGALCILWLVDHPKIVRHGRLFSVGLAAVVFLGLFSEHPLHDLLRPEYDRLSAPHALMALLASAFWFSAAILRKRRHWGVSGHGRVMTLVLAAAVAGAILALTYPGVFSNPIRAVDPEFWELYVRHFAEYRSFLTPGVQGLGFLLVYLGGAILALPHGLWMVTRNHPPHTRAVWAPVCVGLAVFVPLALVQLRFALWAGVVIAISLAGLLCHLNEKLDAIEGALRRSVVRVSLNALILTGFMIAGLAIVGGSGAGQATSPEATEGSRCSTSRLATFLESRLSDTVPKTIVANGNIGPELVYRTRHSVLAAPYHRNARGVLDTHRILTSTDLEDSWRIVESRGVDLILVCPEVDQAFFGETPQGQESLYIRLVENRPPRWLEAVGSPGVMESGFLVFEVTDE